MKILLTGSGGYIGGRLLDALVATYGKDAICLLTSKVVPGFDCLVYKQYRLFDCEAIDVSSVEVVIHAGAFTPKEVSEGNLIEQSNDNIYFTEQLLRLPFKSLRKIINLSTLDVYAPAEIISEASPVAPISLYGCSKLYCENMIKAYASERNISYHTLRVGHVYGPGEETYRKIIPITIANIIKGGAVEIWGDGLELRSFIYIDDVIKAITNSIESDLGVDVVNLVSGNSISIKDLVVSLVKISGKNIEITFKNANRECRSIVFDNSLLFSTLLTSESDLIVGLTTEYKYMKALYENNI
ncbi:NAD-dependent epimerase/dehydratase family protein [Simiduia litorea]|uniref:NAD-dependent epimerase/dehydratase family protein n=1 Tax=Simiduia litorea TaxID=1435348 RepID=UPI0036F43737